MHASFSAIKATPGNSHRSKWTTARRSKRGPENPCFAAKRQKTLAFDSPVVKIMHVGHQQPAATCAEAGVMTDRFTCRCRVGRPCVLRSRRALDGVLPAELLQDEDVEGDKEARSPVLARDGLAPARARVAIFVGARASVEHGDDAKTHLRARRARPRPRRAGSLGTRGSRARRR